MRKQELIDQIEALKRRLEEAEDTIRAIRKGEVDAIVVEGVHRGVEEPCRIFLEAMNEGAVTLVADGTITYSNRRFAEMVQVPLEQLMGASLAGFVDPEYRARIPQLLERACAGSVEDEIRFVTANGAVVWSRVSLYPTPSAERTHLCLVATDLSERRKGEAMHAALAAIVDSSEDAIFSRDLDGRVLTWNPGADKLFGHSALEMIGRTTSLLLPPERHDEYFDILKRINCGEAIRHYETELVCRDGRRIHLSLRVSPLRDSQGALVGTSTIARDITERKLAEQEILRLNKDLKRRVDQWKAYVEKASVGVMLADASGRHIEANRAAEEILGYPPGGLLGTHVWDLPAEEEAAAAARHIRQVHEKGWADGEFRLRRKDGGRVWCNLRAVKLADGQMMGIFQNINIRKLAERALRQSEERLRAVTDSAGDAILMVDAEQRISFWNPAAERIFGYRRSEAIGRPMQELIPPNAVFEEELKRAAHPGYDRSRVVTWETEKPRKDGSLFWAEVSVSSIWSEAGQCVGWTGITRDITERKRAEAEHEKLLARLAQAQKMESVGRLAGGVAHDFNNLLTVINGYSKLLLAALRQGDPLRNQLEEIHKAGERAAALTGQLLAFSRKQMLQPRVLDLNQVVADMQSMLRRLVGEDVEVNFKPCDDKPMVHADPHQLEQVVMNLAVNSRDAMPRGGRIFIETALVDHDGKNSTGAPPIPAGRYSMLTMADTGNGMDESTRQRIFEPFFTTKGVGQGTGLGLSTVQGIVEQSGGYIDVSSELGEGTAFRIYLPALSIAMLEADRSAPVQRLRGSETILVVEDQGEVREFATVVLKSYGYRVIAAPSAADALLVCEKEGARIHLVLTDVVMPRMSGRELVEQLARLRPNIKVLFMSGYTDDAIVRHGVRNQGGNFLQKPFTPEALAGAVRDILGGARSPGRIVVAADETGVHSYLCAVLEAAGYEVVESKPGRASLLEAVSGDVDLVVTDLLMPEQVGIETIRCLRRESPGVGIIAISAAFGGSSRVIARDSGADAVLTRPLNPETLVAKVEEILAARR